MVSMGKPALRRTAGIGLSRSLERLLRLLGPDGYRYVAEHLHQNVYPNGFVLGDIKYHADPCSVGHTPHGEITGRSAADLVRERGLPAQLNVLDLCCGVGIVGLTMLSQLRDLGFIRRLTFVDINIFNLSSLEKTLAFNPAEKWGGAEIETALSDALKHVPPANQFDLIVSNPPHFDAPAFTETVLKPTVLGTLDAGWSFHRDFYRVAHNYLTDKGEIWFLENRKASPEQDLRGIVAENKKLEVVDVFDDRRDPNVFWMIIRRVQEAGS